MYRFIVKQPYARALCLLEKRSPNLTAFAKEVGMVMNTINAMVSQWQKEGLVTKVKEARDTEIRITDYGRAQIKLLKSIQRLYDEQQKKSSEEVKPEEVDQPVADQPVPQVQGEVTNEIGKNSTTFKTDSTEEKEK